MPPIYFDEISNDDVLIFTDDVGVSIDIGKNRFLVFKKVASRWKMANYSLEDFRSFEVHAPGADEIVAVGKQGIGTAIGVAARNAAEKKRARNATGIQINLRRTDRPSLFLKITDDRKRASAAEALRQFCEEGRLREPFSTGEMNVADTWRRPSEEEVNQSRREAVYKARRQEAWATSLKPTYFDIWVTLAVSAFAACLMWLVYRQMVYSNVGRHVDFFAEDIVIYFFVSLPIAYILISWLKVRQKMRNFFDD